jgi:DNA polymerase I
VDKLIVIDANGLVHRAYHALPPLNTSTGEQTNATLGFATMLIKVLNGEKPDYIAIAFDKGRTFRHDEFPDYKAQRPQMAEDLRPQFVRVRQIVEAFGFPIFEQAGFEADDVIGTLAKLAVQRGLDVTIVTGDTDTLQLVEPHVRVIVTQRGMTDTATYDIEAVRKRYGLEPAQLTDLRGLRGDTSDNIPQIPGIGDKTAQSILEKYGTVENAFASLPSMDPKLRAKLEGYAEQALKNKHLATIVCDVPVTLDLAQCRVRLRDRDRILSLFRELEFRSLVDRIPAAAPEAPATARGEARQMGLFGEEQPAATPLVPAPTPGWSPTVELVDTPDGLSKLVARLEQTKELVLDTESTSPESMRAGLVGISLSLPDEHAYYIPIKHEDGKHLPEGTVEQALRPVFADGSVRKIAHNAKYDLTVLAEHGLTVNGLVSDTMVAAYLLGEKAMGLKDLAFTKLGVTMTPITDLIGKGKDQVTMWHVPVSVAAPYAGADAVATLRLQRLFDPQLKQMGLDKLYSEVEIPLVPVLMDMERTGVALDVPLLQEISRDLAGRIAALEDQIYASVGHRFNINSTQQLAGVLFEELKLAKNKRTKTGYSTDSSVLEDLRGTHEVVDLILEYRQLVKLKSTYVDTLPLLINPKTGRVHTSYNQTVAATGRLSSSDPNLQNIPIRTDVGRLVRRAFIAQGDRVLLSADYSQIELRILAHFSQDPALMAAFRADEDIHTATAAAVYGVPLDKVTKDQRRVAKTINFGVAYGVGGYGLAQNTGLPQDEATRLIQEYFERYPGIKTYVEETKRQAKRDGYVSTLLGRRRYLPELKAQNRVLVSAGERMAINMPIQGTAADVIKIAMVRLQQTMIERKMRSKMILQVHDELVFEVDRDELSTLQPLVRDLMEQALPMSVRIKVDVKSGKNWDEMA